MLKILLAIGFCITATTAYADAGSPANRKAGSVSPEDSRNEMVDVEFSIDKQPLRRGETGTVLISFKPKKGILITTDPPFELSFDTLGQFFSMGKTTFAKDRKGYLKTQRSVSQRFRIAKDTPPGIYRLKGTFVYYYCSDEEGWCSRFKQPVEFTVNVN